MGELIDKIGLRMLVDGNGLADNFKPDIEYTNEDVLDGSFSSILFSNHRFTASIYGQQIFSVEITKSIFVDSNFFIISKFYNKIFK